MEVGEQRIDQPELVRRMNEDARATRAGRELSAERLVFADESGASTQMTRCGGRSPIGQRLVCPVPHGHYQPTTLIAAVRLQGPQAPWLFGGAAGVSPFRCFARRAGVSPSLRLRTASHSPAP